MVLVVIAFNVVAIAFVAHSVMVIAGDHQVEEPITLSDEVWFEFQFTNATNHGCRYNLYANDGTKAVRVGYIYYSCQLSPETYYLMRLKDGS